MDGPRKVLIAVVMAAVMLDCQTLRGAGSTSDDAASLSAPGQITKYVTRERNTPPMPWELVGLPSSAAPEVRAIALDEAQERHWPMAFRVLGFVGQEQDVALIASRLEKLRERVQTAREAGMISIYCDALGALTRRNCPGAAELLRKVTRYTYWVDTAVGEGVSLPNGMSAPTYFTVRAAQGYVAAESDRLAQELAAINESIPPDQQVKVVDGFEAMVQWGSTHHRKMTEARTRHGQKPALGPQQDSAATDRDRPAKAAIQPPATAEWSSISESALAAFVHARTLLTQHRDVELVPLLADNGKPLAAQAGEDAAGTAARMRNALDHARAVIERIDVKSLRLNSADLTVRFGFDEVANQAKITELRLKIPAADTQPIAREITDRFGVAPECTTKGDLFIVMLWVNGSWYWNPIGW